MPPNALYFCHGADSAGVRRYGLTAAFARGVSMPNKYEREIEEILRNMDHTESKTSIGNRIRSFNRPRPRARRSWQAPLNRTETLFLVGILLALAGAGLAYYFQSVYVPGTQFSLSGILALAGFACIVFALVLAWRDRFRGLKTTIPANRRWRGASDGSGSKIVEMRPRRGPLSAIATQARLFRLKLRYRRTRGSE